MTDYRAILHADIPGGVASFPIREPTERDLALRVEKLVRRIPVGTPISLSFAPEIPTKMGERLLAYTNTVCQEMLDEQRVASAPTWFPNRSGESRGV